MSFDVRTEYQDRQVAENYDRQRFYSFSGRVFQWAERRSLQRIVRRIPPGSLVLDSPCGTGRLMDLFLRQGLRTLGGDISAEMASVARRRTAAWNGQVTFSRMDFLHIPLADRSVTAVFSIRFLPHIAPEERVRMLREFRRVTRQWVVVSLGVSSPWYRFRRRVKTWLGHEKPVRHPVTERAMAEEFRQAGLREVFRTWTFPLVSEQVVVVCEPV